MPFEMVEKQSRLWEVENRYWEPYCNKSCSIYFGSKEDRIVQIKEEKNICYCLRNKNGEVKFKVTRWVFYPFNLIGLFLRIKKICKKDHIDVIISQSNGLRDLEIAALTNARFYSIPFVGYVGRNATSLVAPRNLLQKVKYFIEKSILKYSDKIILRPATEKIFSEFYQIDKKKIITVPHATQFHCMKENPEISLDIKKLMSEKKVILYYGRFEKDKHIEDIIHALSLIREKNSQVQLLLIGFGREKVMLERLSKEMQLNSCISFKSSMSQEKLAFISRRADIHIHPTGGKGMLESAVLGRPVIIYDKNSYDYGLIEHEVTGLKAIYRNPASLAECISRFLKDSYLREKCGKNLKLRAINECNTSSAQKKLSEVIELAIREKKSEK